jgi:hypothetical protein
VPVEEKERKKERERERERERGEKRQGDEESVNATARRARRAGVPRARSRIGTG